MLLGTCSSPTSEITNTALLTERQGHRRKAHTCFKADGPSTLWMAPSTFTHPTWPKPRRRSLAPTDRPAPPHEPTKAVRILPVGRRAILLEVDDHRVLLGLYAEIQRRRENNWPGPPPTDVILAARTILVDGLREPARLAAEIQNWPIPSPSVTAGELVECPTVYGGPDLGYVARYWGMTEEAVVETHTSISFHVAFYGFSPGFAYLAGLPPELAVPRRASPRPTVPAGAVALAGEYGAIYPRQSPGGWQLIGRTDLVLWNPAQEPPALLAPGTPVRFVRVAA